MTRGGKRSDAGGVMGGSGKCDRWSDEAYWQWLGRFGEAWVAIGLLAHRHGIMTVRCAGCKVVAPRLDLIDNYCLTCREAE